jgi:hypothetical protein
MRPANDRVRARAHGLERFAPRAAVAEKTPAGALLFDIDSASALVGAIVPFHEIIVSLDQGARHCELGSAAGAQQRTRKHEIEALCDEVRPDRARLAFALLVQRKIGAAGMLCCARPRGLAVANEVDHRQCVAHFVALSAARCAPHRQSRISGMSSP